MTYTYAQNLAIVHDHIVSLLAEIEMRDSQIMMDALAMLKGDVNDTTFKMLHILFEHIIEHGSD
jgi:hypothetical protein